MARVYPFPIDLSKNLDDLELTDGFPFVYPEALSKAFDFSFTGVRNTFYFARLHAAMALADRLNQHVFEFSFRLKESPEVGFYGFSVASSDRELRDRFSALLIMAS